MQNNPIVKKIFIKTRKQIFSEIIGNNNSSLKGEGYDFLELKEYEYGEDAKNIDWVISAKMQKPYVKCFHAQKELNIHIVSFLSGSLFFGTSKFKQELLSNIASLLAFSSIKQGDPFSAHIANTSFKTITHKSKRFFSVQQMIEYLLNYDLLNQTIDYQAMIHTLYQHIKKRSIIFLLGDFFDTAQIDLRLLAKKHEVYVIVIRDQFEEHPKPMGQINLLDPQTGEHFDGLMDATSIQRYQSLLKQQDHLFYEHLQTCGIKTTKIYTHEEPLAKLIGVLK